MEVSPPKYSVVVPASPSTSCGYSCCGCSRSGWAGLSELRRYSPYFELILRGRTTGGLAALISCCPTASACVSVLWCRLDRSNEERIVWPKGAGAREPRRHARRAGMRADQESAAVMTRELVGRGAPGTGFVCLRCHHPRNASLFDPPKFHLEFGGGLSDVIDLIGLD